MKISLFFLLMCSLLISLASGASSTNLKTFLQENRLLAPAVEQAIVQIGGAKISQENLEIGELTGGLTSKRLHVITLDGKSYVLRPLNPKYSLEERQNEIMAHQYAASMNLAPPLTFVDKDLTLMVMPLVEGHTLTRADLDRPNVVEALGAALKKIHEYAGPFPARRTSIDRARKHYQRGRDKGVALPTGFSDMYETFVAEGEASEVRPVLIHGDLNPANILVKKDGAISLIDWTSARWEDPYTELGYLTLLGGFSERQARMVLKTYLGHDPSPQEWHALKQAQKRTAFLTALVWFDFSESEEDKMIPMEVRIKKLDALLASPDLKEGWDYILREEVVPPLGKDHKAIKRYALGFLKTYLNLNSMR